MSRPRQHQQNSKRKPRRLRKFKRYEPERREVLCIYSAFCACSVSKTLDVALKPENPPIARAKKRLFFARSPPKRFSEASRAPKARAEKILQLLMECTSSFA